VSVDVLVAIFSEQPAWNIPAEAVESLRRRFPEHAFLQAGDEATMIDLIRTAEAAFTSRLTPAALAAAPKLRWVHSPAAGVGGMLFPAMRASRVVLTNSRGMSAAAVAEHALLLMLASARRFPEAVLAQAERKWIGDDLAGLPTLRGRTLAIVGLGAIGRALARAAAALGMTVVGTRKTAAGAPPEGVTDAFGPEGLPTVLACADFVVLAAPLTDETRGMIDAPQLRLMRPSAWLINVARGKLVNEPALATRLRRGGIAGAALDVFDREPLDASSPLWSLPNVLVTPHVGGFRSGYWEAAVDLFAENLGRFAKNERLRNTVDKAAGY